MKALRARRPYRSEPKGLVALHVETGEVMCPRRGPTDIEDCFLCPAFQGFQQGQDERLLCRSDRAALTSVFFFVSRWAINAPGLGTRDAGLALFLSFASPLSLYASAALAALCALLAVASAVARGDWRTFAGAALLAALPVAYLALRG